jgi:murein peptide amidase A
MMRPHDIRLLTARWREVARRAHVRLRRLVRVGKFDVFYLKTPALRKRNGIYVSAGVHGDEPAATEALISWAEADPSRFAGTPMLVFPCVNPWGIRNNQRFDAEGLDLNRAFQLEEHPVIRAMHRATAPYRFRASLHLHEDYDAEGVYLYEVRRGSENWGETLLESATQIIPPDPRPRIDGRKAKDGLVRRRISRRTFEKIGQPEAIWMFFNHTDRAFTVETPSEFAFERRVAAQREIISAVVRRLE